MQKRLGTALCSYKNKRWGAVLSDDKGTGGMWHLTDPNRLYANSDGYAIPNNKGDQVSSIAAIWTIYHHMIMGPPESVESQHSNCPNDDKTWCKYHKDKIFNRNIFVID